MDEMRCGDCLLCGSEALGESFGRASAGCWGCKLDCPGLWKIRIEGGQLEVVRLVSFVIAVDGVGGSDKLLPEHEEAAMSFHEGKGSENGGGKKQRLQRYLMPK
jgi:hypothetical protein